MKERQILKNFSKPYRKYITEYEIENNCTFMGCMESDYSLVFRNIDNSLEIVDTFPDGQEIMLFQDYMKKFEYPEDTGSKEDSERIKTNVKNNWYCSNLNRRIHWGK